MTLQGETKVLKAGDVAIIPFNEIHSGKALTDCQLLDVFSLCERTTGILN